MTAAVYIVGGNRDHEELRYSLRSLAANVPDVTQVWVVGTVPPWLKGVRALPLDPAPEKFANHRRSLAAFASTKGAPREFYLFNEDHYIVERVEGRLPMRHMGPARRWLSDNWRERNTWFRAVRNTTEWLCERLGVEDVPIYEAHTPLLMSRDLVRDALAEYPTDRSVAISMLYAIAGVGGEGELGGNAKVKAGEGLFAKLEQSWPYLSGNQESFNDEVGAYLRDLFPEPCRWEA